MRQKMETLASNFAKDWDKYTPEENWNPFHSNLTLSDALQDPSQQAPLTLDQRFCP